MKIKADYVNAPQWKELSIKSRLPEQLKCLDELAHNMWWAWNYEARNLFKSLDEKLYEEVGHNPVMLLERLSYDRKEAVVKDKTLMKKVNDVYAKRTAYPCRSPTAAAQSANCCRVHSNRWSRCRNVPAARPSKRTLYSTLGVVTTTVAGTAAPKTACSSAGSRSRSRCSTTSINTAASYPRDRKSTRLNS